MNKNIKVGIVGAGIQGVSNALFLQKKGFNVTIFDRDNPGAQAASYGNAGTKMELCSKNDSLVFKIYHEFNYKKNDAHCKKYASNFRFSITCI